MGVGIVACICRLLSLGGLIVRDDNHAGEEIC